MKTLWDLIYEWKGSKAEAERIGAQASRCRMAASALEADLRSELLRHGPVTNGTEVILPPADADSPIRVLPLTEAINITLTETKTLNPEGGAA